MKKENALRMLEGIGKDTIIVGVDCGFKQVKLSFEYQGKVNNITFSSNVEEGESDDMFGTFYLNGVAYNTKTNKKLTQTTNKNKDNNYTLVNLYRALFEISKLTGFKVKDFVIGIGSSIDTYRSEKAKELFKKNILKVNKANIKHVWLNENEEEEFINVELRILDAYIQPETLSSIYNVKNFNPQEPNLIVDLGGLNNQVVELQGVAKIDSAVCGDKGFDYLVKEIYKECRAQNIDITLELIEFYINNLETYKDNEKVSVKKRIEIIQDCILNYLQEIKKDMITVTVDIDVYNQVFCGGTVDILKPYILKVFPEAIFPQNLLFANSLGMFIRAKYSYTNLLKELSKSSSKEVVTVE